GRRGLSLAGADPVPAADDDRGFRAADRPRARRLSGGGGADHAGGCLRFGPVGPPGHPDRSGRGDRHMSGEPLVRVRALGKSFGEGDAAAVVLQDIDLDLVRGEMVALLGPSGSGKSTLLTILGTLLRPSKGSHEMLGTDLTQVDDAERTRFRNQSLGFVFQFHHLLPDLTALENVMMPAAVHRGKETPTMRARAA